jgi:hypothetical protein
MGPRGPSNCQQPTCDLNSPACGPNEGATNGPGSVSGATGSTDAAQLGQAIYLTGNLIFDIIAASRERNRQRRLEEAVLRDRIQDAKAKRALGDAIESELERVNSTTRPANGSTEVSPTQPVNAALPSRNIPVTGLEPAFPSSILGFDSWTPWYSMRDLNDALISNIDIAYWGSDNGMELSVPRDFPTTFAVRNRTGRKIKITFEVYIFSVDRNTPEGWVKYSAVIDDKRTWKPTFPRQAWSMSEGRVISVEYVEDGKN